MLLLLEEAKSVHGLAGIAPRFMHKNPPPVSNSDHGYPLNRLPERNLAAKINKHR
jgi:hypothetical protein